jgi:hypothetical protein
MEAAQAIALSASFSVHPTKFFVLTGDGASDGFGQSACQDNWVGGGVGDGRARGAVGDGGSARCDGNNISDIGGQVGHSGTNEKSGNNGETHLD